MNNTAIITTLKNVRKHPNADKLQLATLFGSQIIIGLDNKEGDLGIYFDCNLQLSEIFATKNDLIRRKDENGNNAGGMFDSNRKVRAQKLRGEKSDGFWIPIDSLLKVGVSKKTFNSLEEGFEFTEIENIPICNKYINPNTLKQSSTKKQKEPKFKYQSIMFKEHIDTDQLMRNLDKIPFDKNLIITEKLHGTSHRYGHVLVEQPISKWKSKVENLFDKKIFKRENKYQYLSGTRRVVIQPTNKENAYHDPMLRELAVKSFENNLRKGETVYFEIVGYEPNGKPIMPVVNIKDLKDKTFESEWKGKQDLDNPFNMTYKYGCEIGKFDLYVYRITLTNEDGWSYDYSWEDIKTRCKELGVKHVPEISTGNVDQLIYQSCIPAAYPDIEQTKKYFVEIVEDMVKKPSTIDKSHIREGIVLRVETGLNFIAYKHKSFEFKVLEGIISESGISNEEDIQSLGE